MLILDDKQLFVRELFCHWRVLSRIAWLLGLLDTAKLMKIFVIAIVQAVFFIKKTLLNFVRGYSSAFVGSNNRGVGYVVEKEFKFPK